MKIDRDVVHQKYGGRCAYCGEKITIAQMQVDHIIPKRHYSEQHGCLVVRCQKFTEYGLDDLRNLNPACRPCNNRKAACTLEEFREEIAEQVRRLRRDSNQFRLAERFGLVAVQEQPVRFYFENDPKEQSR
jgi:5-methylcytosine-specific restriction endonuclease McrA